MCTNQWVTNDSFVRGLVSITWPLTLPSYLDECFRIDVTAEKSLTFNKAVSLYFCQEHKTAFLAPTKQAYFLYKFIKDSLKGSVFKIFVTSTYSVITTSLITFFVLYLVQQTHNKSTLFTAFLFLIAWSTGTQAYSRIRSYDHGSLPKLGPRLST